MKLIKFYNKLFEEIFDIIFKFTFILFNIFNLIFVLSPLILTYYFNQYLWLLGLIITIPYAMLYIDHMRE